MTSQSNDAKQNEDAVLATRLAPLRTWIDTTDNQLLSLLFDRAKMAQEMSEAKKCYPSSISRSDRESWVIYRAQSGSPGPLHDENIAAI